MFYYWSVLAVVVHSSCTSSVAARQAAKAQKLEADRTNISSDAELKTDDVKPKDNTARDVTEDYKPQFAYKLPAALEGLSNLPPSVLPPSADAFVGEMPEWG